MTNKQRILLLALLAVLAATLLYPPMHVVGLYGDRSIGRHWLFDRPYDIATIDFGSLAVDWIFIGIVIGAFYIASPFLGKYKQRLYLIAIPTTRIIRICIAFGMLLTALGIPFSFFSKEFEVDFEKWLALLFLRIILLTFLVPIFFVLRSLINFFHLKVYGVTHPKIIKTWDI